MYGSVTTADVLELLRQDTGFELEKKAVQLKHAIKETGVHQIPVKLKEGVVSTIHLKVLSEESYRAAMEEAKQA
jgi:large subunit ribosomal protein L9